MSDPILLAELAAGDPLRRRTALEHLAATTTRLDGALVAAVVACLATPLKAVQRCAADVLSLVEAGARPLVAASLGAALRSDDPRLRWGATYALGKLGLLEPAMIPPLLEALGQRDGDQRWAAADLMTRCAHTYPDLAMAALLGAVVDHEPERRKMALYVLREVAPESCAVRDATIRSLRDPVVGVRFAALSTLALLSPLPSEACTLVLALVRDDPDAGFRRAALCALGHVGRGVSAALVVLEAAVTSDDSGIRRAAQIARRRLAECSPMPSPPATGARGQG